MKTARNKKTENWDLTIGSDFELFAKDNVTGRHISSLDILEERDKHNPFEVDDQTKFFCDNVLVEGNVRYAKTKKELVDNFRFTLTHINNYLEKNYKDRYSLIGKAAHTFEDDDLTHPNARLAGCDPSYNCHTESINPPIDFSTVNHRTSALHWHYGRSDWKDISEADRENATLLGFNSRNDIIKMSDLILGNTLNIIDNDAENSILRRQYYGKAGDLRIPEFGVEYRTPHSYFMRHPDMIGLAYDLIEIIFDLVKTNKYKKYLDRFNMETVVNAINLNQREVSRAIYKQLKLPNYISQQVKEHEKTIHNENVLEEWGIRKVNSVLV